MEILLSHTAKVSTMQRAASQLARILSNNILALNGWVADVNLGQSLSNFYSCYHPLCDYGIPAELKMIGPNSSFLPRAFQGNRTQKQSHGFRTSKIGQNSTLPIKHPRVYFLRAAYQCEFSTSIYQCSTCDWCIIRIQISSCPVTDAVMHYVFDHDNYDDKLKLVSI